MRNTLLIVRQEILTLLTKRSFWIMTIAFPAVILILNTGTMLMAGNDESQEFNLGAGDGMQQLGYVDQSGAIRELPPGLPAEAFRAFASQEAAEQALAAGEVDMVAVLPPEFVESGEMTVIQSQFNPFGNVGESIFSYVIAYNLTGDPVLAGSIQGPLNQATGHNLAPAGEAGEADTDGATIMPLIPFIVLFIFFFLITMSSGYMLSSVSREKENRTVEVLLVSVSPRQLMMGKLLGLSIIALLQMAIWLGGSALIMQATDLFNLPPIELGLSAGFFLWGVVYLVLGYLLYASVMGAIGALAPNAREAGQFPFIVLLPLMIPLWLNFSLTENPDGALAVILSLIPFTAPITMMIRLAAGSVPLWQLLGSVALLALTTYVLVALAARFFRADTLLSSASLKWGRLRSAWRGE